MAGRLVLCQQVGLSSREAPVYWVGGHGEGEVVASIGIIRVTILLLLEVMLHSCWQGSEG